MKKRRKIRHENWYWGKWIYEGTSMDGTVFTLKEQNFEEYDEEKHGWHNSEEYRNGRTEPYDSE